MLHLIDVVFESLRACLVFFALLSAPDNLEILGDHASHLGFASHYFLGKSFGLALHTLDPSRAPINPVESKITLFVTVVLKSSFASFMQLK